MLENSPLQEDTTSSGPVLAATPAGHTLLDSYSTLLGHGIPLPWRIKTTKKPPSVPFDGLPSGPTSGDPVLPQKRRKTIRNISQNEQANIDLHEELKEWLPDAVEQVRQAWISTTGVTPWYTQDRLVMVYSTSPEEQQKGIDLVAWGNEVAELNALDGAAEQDSYCSQDCRLEGCSSSQSVTKLFEQVHTNLCEDLHILNTPATSFLIPPRSGFFMADMVRWYDLLSKYTETSIFNMVLLDPPWRSKSVRRSAKYQEMDMYDLYKIQLPDLLRYSARLHPVLVGVWVTNHAKCRRFVRDKLLPTWGVRNVVDWYWVKITAGQEGKEMQTGGLPVWSFDGPSPRRCYEGLMLGYFNPNDLPIERTLPDKRAFLSVPLEHSRKPLVTEPLRPYLHGEGVKVMEMFARYTPSGLTSSGRKQDVTAHSKDFWLSVGNESLKYNEIGVHCTKGAEQE